MFFFKLHFWIVFVVILPFSQYLNLRFCVLLFIWGNKEKKIFLIYSILIPKYSLNLPIHALCQMSASKTVNQVSKMGIWILFSFMLQNRNLWSRGGVLELAWLGRVGHWEKLQLELSRIKEIYAVKSLKGIQVRLEHSFAFLFALLRKKKVCFKSYLSLISVCSVVFNITYWKNFNGSFTMKSFVILQQAFAYWIVKQFWLFASSRRSDI